MKNRHRFATILTAAAAVLLPAAAPVLGQGESDDSPSDETIASDVEPGEEIVHSWALAPADSEQEGGGGDRPVLSYVADPGDTINDAVSLYNLGNVPLTFRVYATDAFNNAAGEFSLLAGNETPTDVGSWFDIPPEADGLTVLPGNHATIPIVIRVPDDASPGDHVGAVLASSTALSPDDSGQVISVDRRTGTRVYLRVNGPLRPELAVVDLSADYSATANPLGGTTRVSYRIENRGNVRLGGTHEVSVAGPFGIGRQRIPATELPELLPGQGIDITTELDDVPALLLSSTRVEVEPDPRDTGVALAGTSASTTTFTPPIVLLLGLLLIIIGTLGIRAYRRHRDSGETELAFVESSFDPSRDLDLEPERQPT